MVCIFRRVCALALVSLIIVACSKNDDGVALAGLESGCAVNSDCTAPLVCAFRTCHEECTPNDGGGSRDCPSGEQCLASDRPYYVCQNPNEKSCTYNTDCPSPLICGRDLTCRDQCESASDCQSGQACVTGTCANVTELVDGGLVAPSGVDAAVPAAASCTYNTDCPAPEVCRATGVCGLECKGDRDCALGQVCLANRCGVAPVDAASTTATDAGASSDATTSLDAALGDASDANVLVVPDGAPDGYGGACSFDPDCPIGLICNHDSVCTYECLVASDCDVARGFCCSPFHTCLTGSICTAPVVDGAANDGASTPIDAGVDAARADGGAPCTNDVACQDGLFCNGVERCVDGQCAAATTTGCDDDDPCTTDTCTEATKSCAHVATGPIDQDHDGHYAASCGGGADDCDDTNPDVYPGHPEVCDFVDNNCNGLIDEGAWVEGAVTSFASGASSTQGLTSPIVVTLSDGSFLVVRADGSGSTPYLRAFPLSQALVAGTGIAIPPSNATLNESAPGVATNGSLFAFGQAANNYDDSVVTFMSADYTESSTVTLVHTGDAQAAAVAWIPSQQKWAAIWGDDHVPSPTGPPTLYTSWVTPGTGDAGVATTTVPRQLFASQVDSEGASSYAPVGERIWFLAGDNTEFVSWTTPAGHVRWVIMEPTMTSVLYGPFDATASDSVITLQAYILGTSVVTITTDNAETIAHVRFIDIATGAVQQETTFANHGASGSDFRFVPYHSGYLVTAAWGTTIQYGWSPTLTGTYTYNQIGVFGIGDSLGGPAIEPLDDTHVALIWQDLSKAQLNAAIMSCTH